MNPVHTPAKFEVRSFTHSWDNRGYSKNSRSPWIRPRSLFSLIITKYNDRYYGRRAAIN